jgi:hypothetical protein
MKPDDLRCENLKAVINPFEEKGREEAQSFLNWFLVAEGLTALRNIEYLVTTLQ